MAALGISGSKRASGGLEHVAVSFNGGKDCTVLLHLFRMAAERSGHQGLIRVAHVDSSGAFPEIRDFIAATCREDSLIKLYEYKGCTLKEGFERFIEEAPIKGVLIGLRRTDPYGAHAVPLAVTDNGWPAFLRIHPILDWTFSDIWEFLLSRGMPYCSLYDRGFTSIGERATSRPNPRLLQSDGSYAPAYRLEDAGAERESRIA